MEVMVAVLLMRFMAFRELLQNALDGAELPFSL